MDLYTALFHGDSIDVNGAFCRHYDLHLELDNRDSIFIEIPLTDDEFNFTLSFTKEECQNAEFDALTDEWTIIKNKKVHNITVYRLEAIGD